MLRIRREIYQRMIDHCVESLPYEACGILAGKDIVTAIYKIRNTEDSPVSYFMEPKELLRTLKDIKSNNIEMLALYHSHPTAMAYPSQRDLELALYEVYYLIVGFVPELEVRAFLISNKSYSEAPLLVI